MKNVMGVIYTGEKDSSLRELTTLRAIAALPVAGRYRVIDFLLSGMVNSGIHNVGIIVQRNYQSLMDHLGSGKEWDLHGKNEGLKMLPPYMTRENMGVYGGSLDALYSNMNYLKRSHQEYVLFTNSLILYNPNFTGMYESYLASGADVMMLYTKNPAMRRSGFGSYLNVDANSRVTDIEIEPANPRYENVGMDAVLIRKDLLIKLVDNGIAHGYHELVRDVLLRMCHDSEMKVFGYEYQDYSFLIDSIQSYFDLNMNILSPEVRHQVFAEDRPVYTKVRDQIPARYMENNVVVNSMVGDGSIIDGLVDHSVLFRGVKIAKGATVKNCILMQDCKVEEGAYIENCILDKQVTIQKNTRLIGPSSYPIVLAKGMVI